MVMCNDLKKAIPVAELFRGISGEVGGFLQGTQVHFLRLSGCNLRCTWCDTKRTQNIGGLLLSIDEVVSVMEKIEQTVEPVCGTNRRLVLTGGEPFFHAGVPCLINRLRERAWRIQVETNGTYDGLALLRQELSLGALGGVCLVVDYKTRSSGVDPLARLPIETFAKLRPIDWIKIVIADGDDANEALAFVKELKALNANHAHLAFSPLNGVKGAWQAQDLLSFLSSHVALTDTILNCQIHKFLHLS